MSAEHLAYLHGELLGHSPVALLGPQFMEQFYYADLPRMNLIFGAVAYVEDVPAGFIVATVDSSTFMQRALREKFFKVAWVMTLSVGRNPRRLGAVWEALQIMRNLPAPDPGSAAGEILSFGVLPQFRSREFLAKTKLRISQDLLKTVMKEFASRGVPRARVIVDADNLEARLFYLGNGWQPGMGLVPGWRKKTVEFLWQPSS
jgi:ribosomal protein S18 acetylase RimI-like enzyme